MMRKEIAKMYGNISTIKAGKLTEVSLNQYNYISGSRSDTLYVKQKDHDRIYCFDTYNNDHESRLLCSVPIDVEVYVASLEEINCADRCEVMATIIFIQNGVVKEVFNDGVMSYEGYNDIVASYNAEIEKIKAKYVEY